MSAPWYCEAYGEEVPEVAGALCFFATVGERDCASPDECHRLMAAERRRVFRVIQAKAAQGDPDMVYLAGEFTSPEQLLGGPETPPE